MTMRGIKSILAKSAELRILSERINETVQTRGDSPQKQQEWSDACEEFHRRFDSLSFPGGSATLSRVRANDPDALEAAVNFLLADPYHFRSGYLKEYLWCWLQRCELSRSARSRLEHAALSYLDRQISREFWSMCKFMAGHGGSTFWTDVTARAHAAGSPQAFRAVLLLAHGADIHAGARLRREVHRSWLMRKYGGNNGASEV
jgi:hypothetical protein